MSFFSIYLFIFNFTSGLGKQIDSAENLGRLEGHLTHLGCILEERKDKAKGEEYMKNGDWLMLIWYRGHLSRISYKGRIFRFLKRRVKGRSKEEGGRRILLVWAEGLSLHRSVSWGCFDQSFPTSLSTAFLSSFPFLFPFLQNLG